MTKYIWFSLNKSFGGAKNMITFDVVCRAKMALSFNMNKIVMQRCGELQKMYQDNQMTEEEAAWNVAEYRRYTRLPEDIEVSELETDLKFIDDNSLSRIQNEIAHKDIRIEELESTNRLLQEKIDRINDEKARKKVRKQRIMAAILLTIDLFLLLINLILFLFDFIMVVIPKLNVLSQGWLTFISLIGGAILSYINRKRLWSFLLNKVGQPFISRWNR